MVYGTNYGLSMRSICLAAVVFLSISNASGNDCPGLDRADASSRYPDYLGVKTKTAISEWQISNSSEWGLERHNPPFRYEDDEQKLVRAGYCHTSKLCLEVERRQAKPNAKLNPKLIQHRLESALTEWVNDRNKSAEILDLTFTITQRLPWTHEGFPGLQVTARRTSVDDGSTFEIRSYFFADESTTYRITADFDAGDMATYGAWFTEWTAFIDGFKTVGSMLATDSADIECAVEAEIEEKEMSIDIQNDVLATINEGKKFDCPRPFEVHGLVHPPEMVRRGITGKAIVGVKIDVQKEPLQAWIVQSSGHRVMDASAVWGACGLRYSSAEAETDFMVPITFGLEDY